MGETRAGVGGGGRPEGGGRPSGHTPTRRPTPAVCGQRGKGDKCDRGTGEGGKRGRLRVGGESGMPGGGARLRWWSRRWPRRRAGGAVGGGGGPLDEPRAWHWQRGRKGGAALVDVARKGCRAGGASGGGGAELSRTLFMQTETSLDLGIK